jgi:multiple antibiotic resistance protein
MEEIVKAGTLLFVLLNPLLMSVYLADIIRNTQTSLFSKVMLRASITSTVAFLLFGWLGDVVFTDVFHVRFSSFLIFGGIIFLIIALRMMMTGSAALVPLQGGEPGRVAGTIALPFMIGPGTISASVMIGKRLHEPIPIFISIVFAVALATISIILLKMLHDFVHKKKEELLERYIDISGRVIAMFTGTYAIEMIMRGLEMWLQNASLPLQ